MTAGNSEYERSEAELAIAKAINYIINQVVDDSTGEFAETAEATGEGTGDIADVVVEIVKDVVIHVVSDLIRDIIFGLETAPADLGLDHLPSSWEELRALSANPAMREAFERRMIEARKQDKAFPLPSARELVESRNRYLRREIESEGK